MFHIGAGMPRSSQITIDHRFNTCLKCEFYYRYQCLQCGCNVNNKPVFMNKLAWEDQKCPLDKW